MRRRFGLVLLAASAVAGCVTMDTQNLRVVALPVADLRSEPGTLPMPGTHDALEETQVLYGEGVRVLKTQGAWAYVEAIEQPEFSHANQWQGYPGWIMQDVLQPWSPSVANPNAIVTAKWAMVWRDPNGSEPWFQLPAGARLTLTKSDGMLCPIRLTSGATGWISRSQVRWLAELQRMPTAYRREQILRFADEYVGDPYFWGGRCPYTARDKGTVTGVDCSGLVNLVYRMAGVDIPRDAHEQFLRARRVLRPQPADLVFLSDHHKPNWIVHVMLYLGEDELIEAPGTGRTVRRVSVVERLQHPIHELQWGDAVGDQTLYFGAYLP